MKEENKNIYVLMNGISKYFKSINTNGTISIAYSPMEANLFDKRTAKRFKELIRRDYKVEFKIIKL